MIPHEAEYKKESELEGKKNQYAKESGILVIERRACQQKLVCSSRGKSEACEEVQMHAKTGVQHDRLFCSCSTRTP